MTWDGDGLLLGLKQPVIADGRAIVWRLSHPERLLSTGKLDRADLSVHARVELVAGPTGYKGSTGISELMKLPDGRVLILAVALRPKTDSADSVGDWSAMYLVPAPGGAGDWNARKIRDFPGLKAEGVAMGPDASALTVVFDRDADVPRWMRVEVPQ